MTVLMRDELNEADLAWAAADPSVAGVMAQALSARAAMAAEWPFSRPQPLERHPPAVALRSVA